MIQGAGNYYSFNSATKPSKMLYSLENGFLPSFQDYINQYQKSQKVGFGEGIKAFGKGVVKPIMNIFRHPIKSTLLIATSALLVIGTGGMAAPLLVGAGLVFGGYELIKGGYKAITAKIKAEKLAALEDMGEGAFTVGASVAGARSYAKTTSAGSAVTENLGVLGKDAGILSKTAAITKGLGADTITTMRAIPGSAQQTIAMVMSGEFGANIRMAALSSKLTVERRKVADIRRLEGSESRAYKVALKQYQKNERAFLSRLNKAEAQVAKNYLNASKNSEFMEDMGSRFSDEGLVTVKSVHRLKDNVNIFKNNPTVNISLGLSSQIKEDPEVIDTIQTLSPYYGLNFSA